MGQYCFAVLLARVCWLSSSSSSVSCNAAGGRASRPQGAWAVRRRQAGRVGGRHCTAGQYGYVPLGRHLVINVVVVVVVVVVNNIATMGLSMMMMILFYPSEFCQSINHSIAFPRSQKR